MSCSILAGCASDFWRVGCRGNATSDAVCEGLRGQAYPLFPRRDIDHAPGDERLVVVGAALLFAFLEDGEDGWRKRKRRRLEVERTPVAVLDVAIVAPSRKRRHEDVANRGSRDVVEDGADVRVREVDETVATQQNIGAWQCLSGEIELDEPTRLAGVPSLVVGDDCRDDVAADVLDTAEVDVLHPGEVAARRVEQNLSVEFLECLRQL